MNQTPASWFAASMVDIRPSGEPARGVSTVSASTEWRRINGLPRRPVGAFTLEQTMAVSAMFRRPGVPPAQAMLRAIQAWALWEIWHVRGLLAPIGVGCGKTLISLLAPLVLGAQRPLLLLPKKLIHTTEAKIRALGLLWKIPTHIRIMGYEWLGREQAEKAINAYAPDVIIADEVHKLRHLDTGVTRRVQRHMKANPSTVFIGLSGTITSRTIKDYAHLAAWALKACSPLPREFPELEMWAKCLDEQSSGVRPDPGALRAWSLHHSGDIGAIRTGFRQRLSETPGVVTTIGERLPNALEIQAHVTKHPKVIHEAFDTLRSKWALPDGEMLIDGPAVWRAARQLALGFYYHWDPAGPEPWREARKNWAKACREVLSYNRMCLDTEKQVKTAIGAGHYPGTKVWLDKWLAIQPTFTPNTVPVWLTDDTLASIFKWSKAHKGLIWIEHRAVANRLVSLCGLSYYGSKGINARDGSIVDKHDGKTSVLVSKKAVGEGFDLQTIWAENLETSPHPSADELEQKIGRTHRPGQPEDTVTLDMMMGCGEHVRAWTDAIERARYIQHSTGNEQKILYATTDMSVGLQTGPVWQGQEKSYDGDE